MLLPSKTLTHRLIVTSVSLGTWVRSQSLGRPTSCRRARPQTQRQTEISSVRSPCPLERSSTATLRLTQALLFLIGSSGQFGLGFYSSFLIASHVRAASLPPPSLSNPHPKQHVFESAADGTSFKVYEDPRGNTLGERGTEVVMVIKPGEKEWLEADKLRELV